MLSTPLSPLTLPARRHFARPLRSFTLTELMVVVGIIALLAAILLTALGKVLVRSRKAETESRMQQFANACIAFQTQLGFYPGVIPDDVLADAASGASVISGIENAYLHLVGGYRFVTPSDIANNTPAYVDYQAFRSAAQGNSPPSDIEFTFTTPTGDYRLVVDTRKLGEGPRINGKSYPAFYNAGPKDLQIASGQMRGNAVEAATDRKIPDLVDAWGQPILYLHQLRDRGNLVGVLNDSPQFLTVGIWPYLSSTSLGELGLNQNKSIFNNGPMTGPNTNLGKIIATPAFPTKPRGQIILLSAGPDGVYFANDNGPGTPTLPVNDISALDSRVVNDYDDIIVISGG